MKEEKQAYNDDQFIGVYRSIKVNWDTPREAFKKIIDQQIAKNGIDQKFTIKRLVPYAALGILLIAFSFWIRLSETKVVTQGGEQLTVQLPGGSMAHLNAESNLTYYHKFWSIKRIVKLEGEAFFDVSKGKPFVVKSRNGLTKVLGTQFNIFSRTDRYNVTCAKGCVSVKVDGTQAVQLNPGQKIKSDSQGFEMIEVVKPQDEMAWKFNKFVFQSVELNEVFAEIGRRFNVNIQYSSNEKKFYSGRFSGYFINNVLELICKPYGYTFTEINKNEFLIEVDK